MIADDTKCLWCNGLFMPRRGGPSRLALAPQRQSAGGAVREHGDDRDAHRGTADLAPQAERARPSTGVGAGTMNDPVSNRPTDGAVPSPGAHRMVRHRDRRRKGLRCISIELRETEIDLLIRGGRLAGDSRGDLAAVRKALHGFLDEYLR